MTLILTYTCHWFSICVSDRLVTLKEQPYDSLSNKVLVCKLNRAFLTIGYTGIAFIDGLPSDEWLMQQIVPTTERLNYILRNSIELPRSINEIVKRLVLAINKRATPIGKLRSNYLQIGIGGLIHPKENMLPYMLIITKQKNTNVLTYSKAIRYPDRNYSKAFLWISGEWARIAPQLFRQLFREFNVVDPVHEDSPERIAQLFKDTIRHCAHENLGIGDEVMIVSHTPFRGGSSIEFEATKNHSLPNALGDIFGSHALRYSPWIFGGRSIYPPLQLIGDITAKFQNYPIAIKGGSSNRKGLIFMAQDRTKEP